MCGIVGAVAKRDVAAILEEGLRRLEYRGYDSSGMAIINGQGELKRQRAIGKVHALADRIDAQPMIGCVGIAHTRWATHGAPAEHNAHPHISNERVAVVHNGIIENHEALRAELILSGYEFSSETDTEVIVHLLDQAIQGGATLLDAMRAVVPKLEGAYAVAAVSTDYPDELVAARSGSPLILGVGIGERFVASGIAALLPVTDRYMVLEDGDLIRLDADGVSIENSSGESVERDIIVSELRADASDRGEYRHYMLKEIYEQARAVEDTLEGRLANDYVLPEILGPDAVDKLEGLRGVHIIACGTSYHAALIARYWIETLARIPCVVEIASEYRYRQPVVLKNRLFVTISQSGETADTLAALRLAKELGYRASLTICNVPESSLVRESDLALMTRAGPEIGVASTKAFTTQLVSLLMLAAVLKRIVTGEEADDVVRQLRTVPEGIKQVLKLDGAIQQLAERFADKHHALFLGRGAQFPVALEGALKLKEISYIHAEAYAAGELKHGPLALVDADMPIIAVAPNNELLEKLKSNLEEVRARGGQLIVFADANAGFTETDQVTVLDVPHADRLIEPIIYTVPLQLLAYHVAVLKGTDVDQPRNLAKSVTVE